MNLYEMDAAGNVPAASILFFYKSNPTGNFLNFVYKLVPNTIYKESVWESIRAKNGQFVHIC